MGNDNILSIIGNMCFASYMYNVIWLARRDDQGGGGLMKTPPERKNQANPPRIEVEDPLSRRAKRSGLYFAFFSGNFSHF